MLRSTAGDGAQMVKTPSYAGGLDLFQHLTAPLVQEAGSGLAPAFDLMLRDTREPQAQREGRLLAVIPGEHRGL